MKPKNIGIVQIYLWLVVLVATCLDVQAKIIVTTSPDVRLEVHGAPIRFANNPSDFALDGELVLDSNQNVSDKIVLVHRDLLDWSWSIRGIPLQNAGAKALLLQPEPFYALVPGLTQFYGYEPPSFDLKIPILEMTEADYQRILSLFQSNGAELMTRVNVSLDSSDVNEWAEIFSSDWYIAWQVIVGGISATILAFALYEYFVFFRRDGFKLTIPQASLLMTIIGAAIRTIYAVTNPLTGRRLWDFRADSVFLTTHAPFTFGTVFLITLYQHELMTSMRFNTFLSKAKIPFVIAIVIIFAAEIATSVIRAKNSITDYVIFINIIFYIIVAVVFSAYLIATAIRFRNFAKGGEKSKKSLRKVVRWSALSSVCMLSFVLICGFFFLDNANTPIPYTVIFFCLFIAVNMISLIHIITLFSSVQIIQSSSSKKSSGKSTELKTNGSVENVNLTND
jgi:hypothetical protein